MSKVGLYVSCETCGKNARVEAQDSLSIAKVGYDLACGHRNGWDPKDESLVFAVARSKSALALSGGLLGPNFRKQKDPK